MKISGLQIFLSLAATALGASNVVDLDATTFGDHVGSHNLVLAEFFAPWCGHCKNLAPEYEAAADTIKESNEDITLAKVDCTENQELCTEYGVRGFPTLYVFEDGEKTSQYSGARKADDISSYLLKRAQPAVIDVESAKGLDSWLAENKASNPVVFAYFGPKKFAEDFGKIASQKRDDLSFVSAVDSSDLAKKYGGDLVVFNSDSVKDAKPFSGKLSKEAITEFVNTNSFPVFGDLNAGTYMRYIESKVPMLYAFVTEDSHRDLVKDALTPHIDSLNGKANIVFLDANVFGRHAQNLNLREEFPAMVVHDINDNKKYLHDQDVDFSAKSIDSFVKKFLKGAIEPFLRSEPVPETQEEPVYVLVGNEYDKIVLDDKKDVLVEYYAPWCGHCKNLAPKYTELAELFEDNDNVVIAKLDHTQNDVPADISGYPTLILYPAGKKDEPLEYSGSRTVEDLAQFIKDNGNAKVAKAAKKDTDAKSEDDKKEL